MPHTCVHVWETMSQRCADGPVHPLYTGQTSVSLSMWGNSGVTGRAYSVDHWSSAATYYNLTTQYYHGDHLGSSRMLTNAAGYPVWQGTFLPFGY